MTSGADIFILNRLNELAMRCGLSPLEVDFHFSWLEKPGSTRFNTDHHYVLSFVSNAALFSSPAPDEKYEKIAKLAELIGLKDSFGLTFETLAEANAAIDRALALAPRARAR